MTTSAFVYGREWQPALRYLVKHASVRDWLSAHLCYQCLDYRESALASQGTLTFANPDRALDNDLLNFFQNPNMSNSSFRSTFTYFFLNSPSIKSSCLTSQEKELFSLENETETSFWEEIERSVFLSPSNHCFFLTRIFPLMLPEVVLELQC